MSIYKVHITTEGNITTYKTNSAILATVIYRNQFSKFDVNTPSICMMVDTMEEADKMTRVSISDFMASVGLTPQFINE